MKFNSWKKKSKPRTRAEVLKLLGESVDECINAPFAKKVIGDKFMQWQVNTIISLQRIHAPIISLMSLFGSGEFLLLALCFLRWQGDPELYYKPHHAACLVLVYSGVLKAWCRGPRPYWLSDKIKTLDPTLETSFGFPSGHTTAMFGVYGVVCWHYYKDNMYAWAIWATLSLLVGFSRVYTGAHFLHDVLGGMIIGLVTLAIEIFYTDLRIKGSYNDACYLLVCAVVAITSVIICAKHFGSGSVRIKLVYESVAGAGFSFGIVICHLLDIYYPCPASFNAGDIGSPGVLNPVQCFVGVLGIGFFNSIIKRLPENEDGTRSIPSLLLSSFFFTCIMVWALWVWPHYCICM